MNFLLLISVITCWGALLMMLWTVIKSPSGLAGGIIWFPKILSSAWSPLFVLAALIGAIIAGWMSHVPTMLSGLVAALLGVRHIWTVAKKHHQFDHAFGKDWQEKIPAVIRPKLWKRRYQFIQPSSPHSLARRNVEIGRPGATEKALLCDIHEPNSETERTGLAIIYLHGGAWQAFDKGILTAPLFDHLCDQGHVILDLAYSLAPEADLNRMLSDVKQAIIWLKSHAGDYQVNPDRIVMMGVSGGAHLALLAAYAPDHRAFQGDKSNADISVRAVIALLAVTDMGAYYTEYGGSNKKQPLFSSEVTSDLLPKLHDKTWLDRWLTSTRIFPAYRYGNIPGGALLLVNLLGGTLKEIQGVYQQASPVYHVSSACPATMLIYAQQDFFVDVSHGRRLHELLNMVGVTSVLLEVPETVHAFDQFLGVSRRIAPAAQTVTFDIERFLAMMV